MLQEVEDELQHSEALFREQLLGPEASSIINLRKLKLSVQQGLDHLGSSLPFNRQYPADILKIIFEWAVRMDRHFKVATRISHVSRHWRYVALQTPRLWRMVDIRTDLDPADIKAFWQRSVQRLAKGIPPSITLELVGGLEEKTVVEFLRLQKVVRIRRLWVQVKTSASVSALNSLDLGARTVDDLNIDCYERIAMSDVLPFAHTFGSVSWLTLHNPVLMSFENTSLSPLLNVKRLFIDSFGFLIPEDHSLTQIARIFPNLRVLKLEKGSYSIDNPDEALWPKLHTLELRYLDSMPFADFKLPNMTSLEVYGEYYDEDDDGQDNETISFIAKHPSLQHLTFIGKHKCIPTFLDSVSHLNLESLIIECVENLGDPSSVRRSRLQDLSIIAYDWVYHITPLTPPLLAKIAENRFRRPAVAMKHADSLQESVMLRILVNLEDGPEELGWLDCDLVASALENVTLLQMNDDTYRSYNLKFYI
jgi:hypothetical protein